MCGNRFILLLFVFYSIHIAARVNLVEKSIYSTIINEKTSITNFISSPHAVFPVKNNPTGYTIATTTYAVFCNVKLSVTDLKEAEIITGYLLSG